ncbi:WD40-repeat-containing domain protein [Chiua virens]|nr:WD40-repeat-containing domain protein [Chiua virens]
MNCSTIPQSILTSNNAPHHRDDHGLSPNRVISTHTGILVFAYFGDGRRVVTGSHNTAEVWDMGNGEQEGISMVHDTAVLGVAVTKDDTKIISADWSNIKVWDAQSHNLVKEWTHPGCFGRLALSPDDRLVAITGIVGIYTLQGTRVSTIDVSADSVCFSPDGSKLACGRWGVISVYDVTTGKLILGPLNGHQSPVWSVLWSHDGARIFSGSDDKTILCWDSTTGEQIGQDWEGHTDSICSLSLSPDGSTLASASVDKTVRFWDTTTGSPIGCLQHPDFVVGVSFSPFGESVVSATWNGKIYVWQAPLVPPLPPIQSDFAEEPNTHSSFSQVALSAILANQEPTFVADGHSLRNGRLQELPPSVMNGSLPGHFAHPQLDHSSSSNYSSSDSFLTQNHTFTVNQNYISQPESTLNYIDNPTTFSEETRPFNSFVGTSYQEVQTPLSGTAQTVPSITESSILESIDPRTFSLTVSPARPSQNPQSSFPAKSVLRRLTRSPSLANDSALHTCGWINDDGTMCAQPITTTSLSHHLTIHGANELRRDHRVSCRWTGCRLKDQTKMNRESMLRHVREVHMGLKRSIPINPVTLSSSYSALETSSKVDRKYQQFWLEPNFPHPPDLTPFIIKYDERYSAVGGFGDVYRCRYVSSPSPSEVAVKALRFKVTTGEETDDKHLKVFFLWSNKHESNLA